MSDTRSSIDKAVHSIFVIVLLMAFISWLVIVLNPRSWVNAWENVKAECEKSSIVATGFIVFGILFLICFFTQFLPWLFNY